MTQPHLLEQAKQGDPQAIAALMNKSLQPKDMTAYVERQGDHLDVVLKSDRIPNRQALTAFVEQGIHNLGVETIRSVTVSGQQLGASSSAWTEQLDLNPLIPEFEPEFADPVAANITFDNVTLDSDAEHAEHQPNGKEEREGGGRESEDARTPGGRKSRARGRGGVVWHRASLSS